MDDTARHRRDSGASLLEMIIVISIVGVLSVSLLGGIAAVLRNQESTASRVSESRDSQMMVILFPQDVQSSPPIDVDAATDPALPSGCSGSDEGVNILRMDWPGYVGASTSVFRVSYRVVEEDSGTVMKRYACSGSSLSALGPASKITVSKALQPLPDGWTPGNPPVRVYPEINGASLIVMVLTEETGRQVTIAASRRNTAATLPPEPVATTIVLGTTTTSSTTTTVAPTTTLGSGTTVATTAPPATTLPPATTTTVLPACTATVAPNPVGHSGNDLAQSLTVSVTTNASCPGAVKLAYSYGNNANNYTTPQNMTSTGTGTWTFTIPRNADNWKAGDKNVRLYTATNNPVITFFGAFTVT